MFPLILLVQALLLITWALSMSVVCLRIVQKIFPFPLIRRGKKQKITCSLKLFTRM